MPSTLQPPVARRIPHAVSLHGQTWDEKPSNVAAIVEYLEQFGYGIRHVETGEFITSANSAVAAEGHLFASIYS